MAFKLVMDTTGSPMVIRRYLVTNSETIQRGEALKLASGRLTKAGATDEVAAIATHAVTGGTDQYCEVIVVTGSQVYEVEYTGSPDVGFVAGLESANLDTTGMKINAAAAAPTGAASILQYASGKCQVMFKKRQLN